jgi:hypothetical protein
MIRYRKRQYHLIKIDLSEKKYGHDMARAINIEYSQYRGRFWSGFSCRKVSGIEYVKVCAIFYKARIFPADLA